MNLRTLKKLSKRAAPLLPLLGDEREQFSSRKHDNYHHEFINDCKHWDRDRCHPNYAGRNEWLTQRGAEIVFTTREGQRIVMRPPTHPRKGTVMVGAVSGYYEPEWDEQDAWSALNDIVCNHFEEWSDEGDFIGLTRDLRHPSQVLAAAAELVLTIIPTPEAGRAALAQGGGE